MSKERSTFTTWSKLCCLSSKSKACQSGSWNRVKNPDANYIFVPSQNPSHSSQNTSLPSNHQILTTFFWRSRPMPTIWGGTSHACRIKNASSLASLFPMSQFWPINYSKNQGSLLTKTTEITEYSCGKPGKIHQKISHLCWFVGSVPVQLAGPSSSDIPARPHLQRYPTALAVQHPAGPTAPRPGVPKSEGRAWYL